MVPLTESRHGGAWRHTSSLFGLCQSFGRHLRLAILDIKRSALVQRIFICQGLTTCLLLVVLLFAGPHRAHRETVIATQAETIAGILAATFSNGSGFVLPRGTDPGLLIQSLNRGGPTALYMFASDGTVLARYGAPDMRVSQTGEDDAANGMELHRFAKGLIERSLIESRSVISSPNDEGSSLLAAAVPVLSGGIVVGGVFLAENPGFVRSVTLPKFWTIAKFVGIAVVVSLVSSLLFARTIAAPLSDLATAADMGQEKLMGAVGPSRIHIPDLSHRRDEIGRLSTALRGMVASMYDRIECNEQFAADVAHEIKNPLASLGSAVGTLKAVKKEEIRDQLLDVIGHDIRRMDRLVSDIANASRLDSDLAKEDEVPFDLLKLLVGISEDQRRLAASNGIDLLTDFPKNPIMVSGFQIHLAQVFVNLICNAISFCKSGDSIRIWARRRQNRVIIVVEDTGPGIPDSALTKIFDRFYSERPKSQFGNNSGLGLAISKRIVEAHGGVIWAENIRSDDPSCTAKITGARFVVGLST